MTEENNQAENNDFKVVVPKANHENMPATPFKAQPAYLEVFANFYIAKFNDNDLEIMNTFDTAHEIVDINSYLIDNIDFSRRNLVKHVLAIHEANFKRLLAEVTAKTGVDPESMTAYADWERWYTDQRGEISHALS